MPHLAISDQQLKRFCQAQHIRRLSLFGSTLAGTARPDSDIDLLVEFEPGWEPGLLGLATMAILLAERKSTCEPPRISAGISATRFCGPLRFNMRDDDRVRILHMIDAAEAVIGMPA